MSKVSQTIQGIVITSLIGGLVWLSTLSGDVRINTNDIKHMSTAQKDHTEAIRSLTAAVIKLNVYLDKGNK